MNIYTFPKESIRKIATRQTLSIYPILISTLIAVYFIINHVENNEGEDPMIMMIIMGCIGLFMLIGGFFSGRKAIERVLLATKFIIEDDVIRKHIPNGKDIEIAFNEIINQEHSKKGIRIKTRKKQLFIPSALINFNELEAILKSKTFTGIQYFNTKYKMNETLLKNVSAIGVLILLVTTIINDNKIYKLLAGVPLVLVLGFAFFSELKNKKTSTTNAMFTKISLLLIALIIYLISLAIF